MGDETKDFRKKLEKQGEKLLRDMELNAARQETVAKGSHYRTRIFSALKNTSYEKEMTECEAGGSKCGSVFCAGCRERKQKSIYEKFMEYYDTEFGCNENKAKERLRWVTVLHSLVIADSLVNVDEVVSSAEEMKKSLEAINRKSKSKYDVELWLRGGVHIELIDYDLYQFAGSFGGKKTAKQNTLQEFVDQHRSMYRIFNTEGKYYLVHFHALVDRKTLTDDELRYLFTERWCLTKRQVHIQRIWDIIKQKDGRVKTLNMEDNLLGMSRYCFNMSNADLSYAANWGASNTIYETYTETMKDKVVSYAVEVMNKQVDKDLLLTTGDIASLVEVHNKVDGSSHRGLWVSIY